MEAKAVAATPLVECIVALQCRGARQSDGSVARPTHPVIFLPSGDAEIIRFLASITRIAQAQLGAARNTGSTPDFVQNTRRGGPPTSQI